MSLTQDQTLALIAQYESSNRNVPNQMGPNGTPLSSASGYYQITDGTWRDYNKQYPNAMSAPQDVQTQVAAAIYRDRGLQPWSSNTKLINAVNQAGGAANPNGTSLDPITGYPTDAQTDAPLPGNTSTTLAGANQGTLNPSSGAGLAGIWEIVQRGAVFLFGFGIVLIAIAALLFQSKTVKVAAADLATP